MAAKDAMISLHGPSEGDGLAGRSRGRTKHAHIKPSHDPKPISGFFDSSSLSLLPIKSVLVRHPSDDPSLTPLPRHETCVVNMSDSVNVEKRVHNSPGVVDEKTPYETYASRQSTASDIPAGEAVLGQ